MQLISAMESAYSKAPRQLTAGIAPPVFAAAGSEQESQAAVRPKHGWWLGLLLTAAAVIVAGLASSAGRAQLSRLSTFLGFPVREKVTSRSTAQFQLRRSRPP